MSLFYRWLGIALVLSLQLTGLFYFGCGFFPKKLILSGQATFAPNLEHGLPSPPFKKLVFVVIDAFRSDFAFSTSSNMPFIHSSIRERNAIGYTAFSSPPTVTLPRIKGLTTGSAPNFLDAILNIAEGDTSSTLSNQDSWVSQLLSRGKKINMFGDDTWIKLFPDTFNEFDGTSSFFVSDFTEVDNNVTRHIDQQFSQRDEWDTLILHYLGLDHIGHKGGPDSIFMPVKQKEMNDIIEKIYHSISDETLLVVVGDHGMNELGNHGGSSAGETSAATIFFSKKFSMLPSSTFTSTTAPLPVSNDYNYYRSISQTDIVPTLSALLNFPIPLNSLGVILEEMLCMWNSSSEKLLILEQNILQITKIMEYNFPGFTKIDVEKKMFCQSQMDFDSSSKIDNLQCLWWKLQDAIRDDTNTIDLSFKYLYDVQSILSQASSNYKTNEMYIGLLVSLLSLTIAIMFSWRLLQSVPLIRFILLIITFLYSFSMFGSSLVEEEHHMWYWGATGWISWLYILTSRKNFTDGFDWVISMVIVRIIRSWNQTGQKYAGSPDISSYLSRPENSPFLWFLIIVYYGSLFERLWKGAFHNVNKMGGFILSFTTIASSVAFEVNMYCQAGGSVPSVLKKIVAYDSVSLEEDPSKIVSFARLSFFIIGMGMLYEVSNIILSDDPHNSKIHKHISNLTTFLELFFVMQTRTKNIPLFIFFNMLRTYLVKATNRSFVFRSTEDLDNNNEERFNVRVISILSISILILQHMSFFAMGNSNSLASIDLSNAYNGLESYNISIVAVLTFVGNWAGPLYWSAAGLSILLEDDIRPEIIKAYLAFNKLNSNSIIHNSSEQNKQFRSLISAVGQDVVTLRIIISQVFFSGALVGVLGACIALKDHLFIWTVFSPKLLYSTSWIVLQHGLVDVIICTALSFFG